MERLPGVEAAGIDCGSLNQTLDLDQKGGSTPAVVALRAVSPGYLRAIGVPLTRGRWPSSDEIFDVVMVNQSLAWRMGGPGEGVLGNRI